MKMNGTEYAFINSCNTYELLRLHQASWILKVRHPSSIDKGIPKEVLDLTFCHGY
jgi:hypothetical protein